jgi:hypothetical protein
MLTTIGGGRGIGRAIVEGLVKDPSFATVLMLTDHLGFQSNQPPNPYYTISSSTQTLCQLYL